MAIENAAANSNNTVSNLTRKNYNKENDVIELKDQQQERSKQSNQCRSIANLFRTVKWHLGQFVNLKKTICCLYEVLTA